ncbi:uncharacterized protein LOC125779709 [Bactrocera dorsalis]|uniref:Uncharacterized protein LOC125779709 n=1 Tax=Bactrocera dorsalis TaxID=27457 RepID=A0ABM3K632_BACDO|nr:uncharacterized protein LOC125779709 [Bactrocera dorsalis]
MFPRCRLRLRSPLDSTFVKPPSSLPSILLKGVAGAAFARFTVVLVDSLRCVPLQEGASSSSRACSSKSARSSGDRASRNLYFFLVPGPLLPASNGKRSLLIDHHCRTSKSSLCSKANSYLFDLSRFLTARNLQLSPTKSWTKEYRFELNIAVDGVKTPTVNNPKILGVTLDSLCSFSPHTTAIIAKVQSRNKILKSLTGSTWGKDKETLLATYKAIGRLVLNYAAPIWSPGCSGTQMRKLQTCQNTALRTTTGCLLKSSIEPLHSETRMLPVKEHNLLLSRQFLLGCFRRNHPCSHLLGAEPPPRSIKRSFLDYVDDIEQYADQTSDATNFRQALTHFTVEPSTPSPTPFP